MKTMKQLDCLYELSTLGRKIGIVDVGVGNIQSIFGSLRRLGIIPNKVTDPADLLGISHLFIPGVGNMRELMTRYKHLRLDEGLRGFAQDGYILGICLGFQVLYQYSEENQGECLGLLEGKVVPFSHFGKTSTNVGRFTVQAIDTYNSDIVGSKDASVQYYFTHSYCVPVGQSSTHVLQAGLSIPITAACNHGNVFGVQFHPELSHASGRSVLRNFLSLSN